MRYEITIPNYRFPSLNSLLSGHWSKRMKLKREAKEMVRTYGTFIPYAEGKRRVDLYITLSARQKKRDPDGEGWKALFDALTHSKLLIDDSEEYVEMGTITYDRGETKTVIYLTDL